MNKLIISIVLILGVLGFLAYNQGWFSPSSEEIILMSLENMADQESVHAKAEVKTNFVSEQGEAGFSLNLDTDIDNSNQEELKTSGFFNTSLAMEGINYSLEGLLVSIGKEDFYLKLETIPQIPLISMFLDVSKLKGEWIKFSNKYVQDDVNQEGVEEISKIFQENNPLEFKEKLSEEKIDGKSAYHYLFSINKEKFKNLVIEINKSNDVPMTKEEIQEITNEDFLNKVGGLEFKIWIDKKEKLLKRLRIENEFEIDPEENHGEQMGLEITEGKIDFSFEINMSDFGKELNIKAPDEFKTLEEILSSLEGMYSPGNELNY
jgi:hypothetical protein